MKSLMKNKEVDNEGFITKVANFFRGGTRESMSRLCTFLGYMSGSYCAIAGVMLNRDLLGTAALVTACYGASAVLKFKSKQAENQCEKE